MAISDTSEKPSPCSSCGKLRWTTKYVQDAYDMNQNQNGGEKCPKVLYKLFALLWLYSVGGACQDL